jgi:hypothetical protein
MQMQQLFTGDDDDQFMRQKECKKTEYEKRRTDDALLSRRADKTFLSHKKCVKDKDIDSLKAAITLIHW